MNKKIDKALFKIAMWKQGRLRVTRTRGYLVNCATSPSRYAIRSSRFGKAMEGYTRRPAAKGEGGERQRWVSAISRLSTVHGLKKLEPCTNSSSGSEKIGCAEIKVPTMLRNWPNGHGACDCSWRVFFDSWQWHCLFGILAPIDRDNIRNVAMNRLRHG